MFSMERNCRVALLLGTFTDVTKTIEDYFILTENAKIFDLNLKGALMERLIEDGPFASDNKVKYFYFSDPTIHQYLKKYARIAVVNLGPLLTPSGLENTNIKFENFSEGIVFAIKFLKNELFDAIDIDPCRHPKIVGTAVALTLHILSTVENCTRPSISVKPFDDFHFGTELEYDRGICLGKGQTLAQQLMKSPSIADFVKATKSFLREFDLDIVVRKDEWMRKKKMNCLLSVSNNSEERPVIIEVIYNNLNEQCKPLILVGKATPYESSLFPLSDKPEFHRFQYRSGMGGASSIIGSLYSLCKLKAPVRVHCIVAVVWNQMHDKSNKKGDVRQTMNGTSIQIDRPEAEGRLIMADVLCYANTLDSSAIMDVTTLSSNIDSLIGNSYIAFFTSDENLKKLIHKASVSSGEKIWQLPLFKWFKSLLKVSQTSHISNVGADGKSVAACKSAAFLREFVEEDKPWIHLDISAVSESKGKKNYLSDWATGRSTRLVSEFCIEFFSENQ